MQNIVFGESVDLSADDNKPVDRIVGLLLEEIIDRSEELRINQAHIENFPLGNEFDPEKNKQFNGMEQLRNISRNNYARVIVDAVSSKCGIEGFRSAKSSDAEGDDKIKELFDRDDMGFAMQDAVDLACTYRKAYLFVDPISGRQKVIPPTNSAVMLDSSGEPMAAIVLTREKALMRDVLRVFIREINEDTGLAEGKIYGYIATRDFEGWESKYGIRISGADEEIPLDRDLNMGWAWWKEIKVSKTERIPVTVLKNRDNKNEFEDFVETITRINHMVWQRVIIVTMQAFRQRAITGNFSKVDSNGNQIDYSKIFEPGPNALWQLPADSEMWESTPTDITQILEAVKADEKALGAQTKTPMNHFSDSVNNSAEGAASQKEAYYDKIDDRRKRFGSRLRRHTSILMEVNGDKDRSNIADLEVIWSPLERLSLNERTAAFASMKGQGLSLKTALREGMKMTPTEIQRAIQELIEDQLRAKMAEAINGTTPLRNSSLNSGQGQAKSTTSTSGEASKAVGNTSETLLKASESGKRANQ